jgi:hypothetical protein
MRQLMRNGIGLMILLAISPRARAQTDPRGIIANAIRAQGGADRLALFKATRAQGEGTLYLTRPVPFTWESAAQLPYQFKNVMHFEANGRKHTRTQVIYGERVVIYVDAQQEDLEESVSASIKEQVYVERVASLLPLLESGYLLTTLGERDVQGVMTVAVKVSARGHADVVLSFDRATGLLRQSAYRAVDPATGKEVLHEKIVSDYRDAEGIKRPIKAVLYHDGHKFLDMELSTLQNLEKLDDTEFEP